MVVSDPVHAGMGSGVGLDMLMTERTHQSLETTSAAVLESDPIVPVFVTRKTNVRQRVSIMANTRPLAFRGLGHSVKKLVNRGG